MDPVFSASKFCSHGFRGGRVERFEANSGSSSGRSADEVREEATSLKRKRGISFNSCVR